MLLWGDLLIGQSYTFSFCDQIIKIICSNSVQAATAAWRAGATVSTAAGVLASNPSGYS